MKSLNLKRIASLAMIWSVLITGSAAQLQDTTRYTGPIIDMHLHAGPGSAESKYYTVQENESPDEARFRTLRDDMQRNNVVLGVVGGPVEFTVKYAAAAPDKFIAGLSFPCTEGLSPNLYRCFASGADWPDPDWLRGEIEAGHVGAFGELVNVYSGISPTDPRMEPFYALASEYELPVAVHAERGPPPMARVEGCCPNFNDDYGNPALYRSALERHPTLRLYLMHIINPEFVDAAIALMDEYPNVYVDTSPMSVVPRPFVHTALRRMVEAGHADRIMFGSDFLGAIGESIGVIEAASFLTKKQKRAIYYNNAARFLELSEREIARHHNRGIDKRKTEN